MLITNAVLMELAMYFLAEFQKPPNYMNKEGKTCFVKKIKKTVRRITVLYWFCENDIMPVINCLTRFDLSVMLYLSHFVKKLYWPIV